MNPQVHLHEVRKLREGKWIASQSDRLTVEEPLEIRVAGKPLAVIMRTPGDDEALAAGFLVTEAIVSRPEEIDRIEFPANGNSPQRNVIDVTLAEGIELDTDRAARNFYATSSCGICGKATIESIRLRTAPLAARWQVDPEILFGLPRSLGQNQPVFAQTGSLHGAGLFDLEGTPVAFAEDVGRHNAVDKVIGRAALAGNLPLNDSLLMVSGRISFEITQKALMAGIPLLGAISGASSLAVELAEDQGMTLVGFIRGSSMTIYHGGWRINGSH